MTGKTAIRAVKCAQDSGFENLNIDIMYGLPQQTEAEALSDVEAALALQSTHFSWYQLTLEPNTAFYKSRPPLPNDDALWEMQIRGQARLAQTAFEQYEVSAYSRKGQECHHNLNYWQFGDYLGIGAGAHSKLTLAEDQTVRRHSQVKNPRDYLDPKKTKTQQRLIVTPEELVFEFMLNALRLNEGVSLALFEKRTGLAGAAIEKTLFKARVEGLLVEEPGLLKATELGKRFLNNLTSLFLPE